MSKPQNIITTWNAFIKFHIDIVNNSSQIQDLTPNI